MANNGNYGWDGPYPHVTSVASSNGAFQMVEFKTGVLMDVDRAETQAAKIRELLDLKPPVELLERLDSAYVGEPELVQVIDDYVIEFATPRGTMRVARRPGETWEECLVRVGLLDA